MTPARFQPRDVARLLTGGALLVAVRFTWFRALDAGATLLGSHIAVVIVAWALFTGAAFVLVVGWLAALGLDRAPPECG